jgi:hypothetical protein
MKNLTLLLTLLIVSIAQAQDSISVLFIGNSYTYVNDLPNVFSQLTNALGDEATVDSKSNGGFTFQNQLNDAATHAKIHTRPWDFVVLQGQSQEPSFPTSQVNTSTLPPAVALADSVYANNYCSQAMYFMTWGRQAGDPQWDSINTFDKMNGRLRDAYVRITDSAQGCVAPVGVAWKYVRDNFSSINLYQSDGSHPSLEGTYLAACTFYASAFRKPTVGATYTAGLDASTALKLQMAADLAVLDSLETWHLRPKDAIAIADFHYVQNGSSVQFFNDSWRATDYSWNFGDMSTATFMNGTHDFASPGTYPVQLIAQNECGSDTLIVNVQIAVSGIQSLNEDLYTIATKGNGIFQLRFENALQLSNLQVFSIEGKELKLRYSFVNEKELELDLSNEKPGIYFLNFFGGDKRYNQKLYK